MYDVGTKVYIKGLNEVGTVIERGRHGSRKVFYIVDLGKGVDYMVGGKSLRRADFCCDGCGRWLPYSKVGTTSAPPHDPSDVMTFCWLCTYKQPKGY